MGYELFGGFFSDYKGSYAGGAAGMAQAYEDEHGYLVEGMPTPLSRDYLQATMDVDGNLIRATDTGEVELQSRHGLISTTIQEARQEVEEIRQGLIDDFGEALPDRTEVAIAGGFVIVVLLLIAVVAVYT